MKEIYHDGHQSLVNDLLTKLKVGTEYIGDLIQVSKMLKEQADERLDDHERYIGDLAKQKADKVINKRENLELKKTHKST
jgi:hypothetical protein